MTLQELGSLNHKSAFSSTEKKPGKIRSRKSHLSAVVRPRDEGENKFKTAPHGQRTDAPV